MPAYQRTRLDRWLEIDLLVQVRYLKLAHLYSGITAGAKLILQSLIP